MRAALKGFAAVVIASGILWAGWYRYEEWLSQGQRPPLATQIMDKFEKEGVPDFEFQDLNGTKRKLSEFQDKVVILNFWASWCAPCVEEFPSFIKLLNKFPGKIILVAISSDRSLQDLTGFLEAIEVKHPQMVVGWDKEMVLPKMFGTEVLPESFVLAPGRKLVKKVLGLEDWASADAYAYFEGLIQGKTE